jgi:hypothetical protein
MAMAEGMVAAVDWGVIRRTREDSMRCKQAKEDAWLDTCSSNARSDHAKSSSWLSCSDA